MKSSYKKKSFVASIKRVGGDYQLYLLLLPAVLYMIIFHYLPMYGVQLAFKKFIILKGITGSPWVGVKHFARFFESIQFTRLIKNTLGLSFFQLIAGFPLPIILALLLNQARHPSVKKIVQTTIYAPHFISVVVLSGMLYVFLSPVSGIVNQIIQYFGLEPIYFLGDPKWFKSVYVISGVWQSTGWGTIIYLASLSSIDPSLYEASIMDGASKFQQIFFIEIPSILPTAVILLILNVGRLMEVGFQKAYTLQNYMNLESSEIISTYIYKVGLLKSQYGYSTAIGLFNTLVNIILLVSVNEVAKRLKQNSLW